MNLGGPDSPEAVKPFLRRLFSDPEIFRFPLSPVTRPLFSWLIATMRTPAVRRNYDKIGGCSPILRWTMLQAELLQRTLAGDEEVFVAMRYSEPSITVTVERVRAAGFSDILLLPLYPQRSRTTTVSSVNEWRRRAAGLPWKIAVVESFCQHPRYIDAVEARIREGLARFPGGETIHILYSAHGIPMRGILDGDPYERMIHETVDLLRRRMGEGFTGHLSYQSRVGWGKWLGPYTHEKIVELAATGVRNLLVVPVSFVSDHFETLYELDMLYREVARRAGIQRYEVMTGLNDAPIFIDALRQLVADRQWQTTLS